MNRIKTKENEVMLGQINAKVSGINVDKASADVNDY